MLGKFKREGIRWTVLDHYSRAFIANETNQKRRHTDALKHTHTHTHRAGAGWDGLSPRSELLPRLAGPRPMCWPLRCTRRRSCSSSSSSRRSSSGPSTTTTTVTTIIIIPGRSMLLLRPRRVVIAVPDRPHPHARGQPPLGPVVLPPSRPHPDAVDVVTDDHAPLLDVRAPREPRPRRPVSPPVAGGGGGRDEPEQHVGQVDPDGVLHALDAAITLWVLVDVHLHSRRGQSRLSSSSSASSSSPSSSPHGGGWACLADDQG